MVTNDGKGQHRKNPGRQPGAADLNNSHPKPFVWTADPKRVLAAVKRGKQALESIH